MKNHFSNARVDWKNWNPSQVIFKSNNLTKKLLPSENVLSWSSKGDRDAKMAKLTGGAPKTQSNYNGQSDTWYSRDNYKGVMVQLKDVKSEYPSANIDFIDYTPRTNSVGDPLCSLDILIYLNSHHCHYDWQQVNGNWQRVSGKKHCDLNEGYLIAYGGQGDANPMNFDVFQEVLQISEAVRSFLVTHVVPAKKGEFDYDGMALV